MKQQPRQKKQQPESSGSRKRKAPAESSTEAPDALECAPELRSLRHGNQTATTAADVVAHQAWAQTYAVLNAQAEVEALMMSAIDRQDTQAKSTKHHYHRFQAHWIVRSCGQYSKDS